MLISVAQNTVAVAGFVIMLDDPARTFFGEGAVGVCGCETPTCLSLRTKSLFAILILYFLFFIPPSFEHVSRSCFHDTYLHFTDIFTDDESLVCDL